MYAVSTTNDDNGDDRAKNFGLYPSIYIIYILNRMRFARSSALPDHSIISVLLFKWIPTNKFAHKYRIKLKLKWGTPRHLREMESNKKQICDRDSIQDLMLQIFNHYLQFQSYFFCCFSIWFCRRFIKILFELFASWILFQREREKKGNKRKHKLLFASTERKWNWKRTTIGSSRCHFSDALFGRTLKMI